MNLIVVLNLSHQTQCCVTNGMIEFGLCEKVAWYFIYNNRDHVT